MLKMSGSRGFSIIELSVALGIMGILLAIALPTFSDYLRNVKVRTEAEALVSGIQLARSEAVRRNAPVEFVLTSDTPTVATVSAAATGPNWVVRAPPPPQTPVFVEGRAATLSGAAAAVRINDLTSPAVDDPDAPPGTPVSSIVFNGLGRPVMAADAVFKLTIPGLNCQTHDDGSGPGPVRCLRVVVTVFGQTRLCDPRAVATDPRSC